jgi:hypothetical protein
LVNLSLSDSAEDAILKQGSVNAVVGLLSSNVLQLQTQAAMLLSNLLGNEHIRSHIRYLSWMEPLMGLIASAPSNTVTQAVRCIVNVTFDNHCRYMLTSSGAEHKLRSASSRCGDSQVSSLVDTAIKNFAVTVSADIQREVNEALRSGKVTNVAAPSSQKAKVTNDFEGLDDILGFSSPAPKPSFKPASAAVPKPAPTPAKPGYDDLDDFLGPSKGGSSKPAAPKPGPAKPASNFDDLDDLLGPSQSKNTYGGGSKPPPAPKPQSSYGGLDDLDSLLGDMPAAKPVSSPPPPKPKPQHQPQHQTMDDIDSLLADMAPAPAKQQPKSQAHDDIDDLLAGLDGGGGHKGSHKSHNDDSIDDLLAGLGSGSGGGGRGNSSYANDSIDDLLADLM